MKELKTKYGEHKYKLIIQGNEGADLQAKKGTEKQIKPCKVYYGLDKYTFYQKTVVQNKIILKPLVDTIRREILQIYQTNLIKQFENKKSNRWERPSVNYQVTLNILKTKHVNLQDDAIKKFFIKIINADLPTQFHMKNITTRIKLNAQEKNKKLTDKQKYQIQIYSSRICGTCKTTADIFHICADCRINEQLQSQKIQEIQQILNADVGVNRLCAQDWLDTNKYANIPRNRRIPIQQNIKLLNTGFITRKFYQKIYKETNNKDKANNLAYKIQKIILSWSKKMYKAKNEAFFKKLKFQGKYIKKYHNYPYLKKGIT